MAANETEWTHPSYVMVAMNRITGGRVTLFGTPLKDHPTRVRLRIKEAKRLHDYNEDRYSAAGGKPLMEIELSAAQFVQVLTNMNVGDGVPGTMRYFNGAPVEDPPETPTEAGHIRDSFQKNVESLLASLKGQIRSAQESLTGKSPLTVGARREISEVLSTVLREVEANLPFVVEQFQRSADRIETATKAEIDAFITGGVQALGFSTLQEVKDTMRQALNAPANQKKLVDVTPKTND